MAVNVTVLPAHAGFALGTTDTLTGFAFTVTVALPLCAFDPPLVAVTPKRL